MGETGRKGCEGRGNVKLHFSCSLSERLKGTHGFFILFDFYKDPVKLVEEYERQARMEENIAVIQAGNSYEKAWELAKKHLPAQHPLRLKVFLFKMSNIMSDSITGLQWCQSLLH